MYIHRRYFDQLAHRMRTDDEQHRRRGSDRLLPEIGFDHEKHSAPPYVLSVSYGRFTRKEISDVPYTPVEREAALRALYKRLVKQVTMKRLK